MFITSLRYLLNNGVCTVYAPVHNT